MRPIRPDEKEHVLDILTAAFDDNQGINWLVKGGRNRKKQIRALMNYTFDNSFKEQEAWVSEDGKGVILAAGSGSSTSITGWFKIMKLLATAIGVTRAGRVAEKEKFITSAYPTPPWVNLTFLAVDPPYQNQGIGAALLRVFLERHSVRGCPVLLETSNKKNLDFYGKHGFAIYNKWYNHWGDFPIWMMKKES